MCCSGLRYSMYYATSILCLVQPKARAARYTRSADSSSLSSRSELVVSSSSQLVCYRPNNGLAYEHPPKH